MSKEVTAEMIQGQMDFLNELLGLMDEEFFNMLTEDMQLKIILIVNKYTDGVEVVANETMH